MNDESAPPLLVPVDLARVDRYWRWVVVAQSTFVVGLVGVVGGLIVGFGPAAGDEAAPLATLGVPLGMGVFVIGLSVATWRGLRAVRTPLEVRADGLVMRTVQGAITAPWDAVAEASFVEHWSGRRFRVRLVPAGDPRAGGIRWDLRGRNARRVAQKQGLVFALRMLAVDADVLAVAVAGHSAGRLRPVG